MKNTVLTLVCLLLVLYSKGQIDKEDWTPWFRENLPTRFFYLTLEGPFNYGISSKSALDVIGDGKGEVSANQVVTARLKFPVLNKERAKISGGIRYVNEQFYFSDITPEDYPMYVGLNDRNLRKLGVDLKGLFHLHDNRSIVVRSSWNLAGDFNLSGERYFKVSDLMKSSLAVGYAIRKDSQTYYAFGAYFGYTFGVPSVYPVVLYNRRLANGVGFDLFLPQGGKVWKRLGPKWCVLANAGFSGTSYTVKVNDTVLQEAESIQLRQSVLKTTGGFIYYANRWVGAELQLGYSKNINFNVSESNFRPGSRFPEADTDYLIKSKTKGAPYASCTLFLTVPKELLERCD